MQQSAQWMLWFTSCKHCRHQNFTSGKVEVENRSQQTLQQSGDALNCSKYLCACSCIWEFTVILTEPCRLSMYMHVHTFNWRSVLVGLNAIKIARSKSSVMVSIYPANTGGMVLGYRMKRKDQQHAVNSRSPPLDMLSGQLSGERWSVNTCLYTRMVDVSYGQLN